MEDIIEDASKFPLSNKVIIEKEEILDIINDIRLKLPEEINRANWVAKERQRILTEAQEEADSLLEKAKKQQENIINESETVKMANEKAEEIVKYAEGRAREMRDNAFAYSDDLLAKLQEKVTYIQNVIDENRQELRNM